MAELRKYAEGTTVAADRSRDELEIVAGGESTFEREFLADTLLPNGDTVAIAMIPRIAQSYQTGDMPFLMLGPGVGK